MTWEIKEQNTITLHCQNRFVIIYEQLDFFSKEFQNSLNDTDCLTQSEDFAHPLLDAIGDHLSRRNLQDIINECENY